MTSRHLRVAVPARGRAERVDTELAPSPQFTPVVLGHSLLGRGYLGYARPFDIADRVIELDSGRIVETS